MIDKSWDWILGYIAAIQNTSNFEKSGGANSADWISAFGSIGASFCAAAAAYISLRAIRISTKISVHNSKSYLYENLTSIISSVNEFSSRHVKAQTTLMIPEEDDEDREEFEGLFKEYRDNMQKSIEILKEVRETYIRIKNITKVDDLDNAAITISGMRIDINNCEATLTRLIVTSKKFGFLERDFHL